MGEPDYDTELAEQFKRIGIEEKRAIETAKNKKIAKALQAIIAEVFNI